MGAKASKQDPAGGDVSPCSRCEAAPSLTRAASGCRVDRGVRAAGSDLTPHRWPRSRQSHSAHHAERLEPPVPVAQNLVRALAELRLAHAAGSAHHEERDLRATITADPLERTALLPTS
jgi:hypothetical protein